MRGWAAEIDLPVLLERLEAARQRHRVAGFALALADTGGARYAGGGGLADRATARAVDADTLWRVGSVTKVFTAMATMVAARRHGFTLDTPLRELVPDPPVANPWEATDPVRVVHLLEHTAGLLDLSKREFDSSDPAPLSLAQAFALNPGSRTLQWPPGRHFSYSNTGPGLAALVIETRDGRPYEAFVTAEVLRPLGMAASGFAAEDPAAGRLAQGYGPDGVTPLPYWHVLYRAFGGLNATTQDMARFLHWMLVPATAIVLTPEEFTRLQTPESTLSARAGLRHGYAKGLYEYVRDGRVWLGHGGDADGTLARVGWWREGGMGYFLAINAFKPEAIEEMQGIVEAALTEGAPPASPPPVAVVDSTELDALTGCYVKLTQRFAWGDEEGEPVLTLRRDGDHLVAIDALGASQPLLPVSPRLFCRAGDPVATSAIVSDREGNLVLQGVPGNLQRRSRDAEGRCVR